MNEIPRQNVYLDAANDRLPPADNYNDPGWQAQPGNFSQV